MPCEQPAKLIAPGGLEERDWLDYLKADVLHAPDLEAVSKNRVSFVTFNFDRVIEFALHNWLMATYGASADDATSVLKRWSVVHVNGQLGGCTWLGDPEAPRPFAPDRGSDIVERTFRAIRIIGDATGETPKEEVTRLFGMATRVFVMGFSFDRTNVHWLQQCGLSRPGLVSYATHFGMTKAEARVGRDVPVLFPEGFEQPVGTWDARLFLREMDECHDYPGC